ncbi:unnamed protein product, partial [Protopolystoma xenopodis]
TSAAASTSKATATATAKAIHSTAIATNTSNSPTHPKPSKLGKVNVLSKSRSLASSRGKALVSSIVQASSARKSSPIGSVLGQTGLTNSATSECEANFPVAIIQDVSFRTTQLSDDESEVFCRREKMRRQLAAVTKQRELVMARSYRVAKQREMLEQFADNLIRFISTPPALRRR